MASKYARRAASEKAVLDYAMGEERQGSQYGVETGVKRPLDQGGVRGNRGAVRPDHAVARRYGHGNALGYSTTDFGPSDQHVGASGRGHLDAGRNRRKYDEGQSWLTLSKPGAGLSQGPAWPSVSRVRANNTHE